MVGKQTELWLVLISIVFEVVSMAIFQLAELLNSPFSDPKIKVIKQSV
jgi:hypothetical protein